MNQGARDAHDATRLYEKRMHEEYVERALAEIIRLLVALVPKP